MTLKNEPISIKELLFTVIGVLLAVIGYFINRELSEINASIKDFKVFQTEQKVAQEKMNGAITLLQEKNKSFEDRINKLEKKN